MSDSTEEPLADWEQAILDEVDAEHRLASELFRWNTPTDPYFVIAGRVGEFSDEDPYLPIARAVLASGVVVPAAEPGGLTEAERDLLADAIRGEWNGGRHRDTPWADLPEDDQERWRTEVDILPFAAILAARAPARDGLAERVRALQTHNGTPVTTENLEWAATHEALCRSWIFDVLTGLAALLAEDAATEGGES